MQKLILCLLAAGFLAGCYCKCSPYSTSDIPPATPEQQPAEKSTDLDAPPVAQPPEAPAHSLSTLLPATQNNPVKPVEETTKNPPTSFGPEQAAALIAKQRAEQTLQTPPADTPVFKKEELLPTSGRLLNPLAYEPIHPDNTHAPWSNESLKYGIYYSFIKAGTAYIKTRGLTEYHGKTAYLIQTTAFSASGIDAVFKVRDINYSWLDTQTLYSLGYSQSVREGNYVRDEWVNFDPENKRFYGEIKKKEEPRMVAGELDQPVLDMLTSLYFVRSQPLETGKDLSFDIINREERYPLLVKVLGKETIKTKAGKFNCWVVEPQFRGEGIFVAKGKSLKVWLTDDEYRMPVKMAVEVFIGSVYAELLDYKRN